MNFFSSAVEMLETITAALEAGLQAWGELKTRKKLQAITREFINRRLVRERRIEKINFGMSPIVLGSGSRSPPNKRL